MDPGMQAINIGAGSGTSVNEIVRIARDVTGKEIPVKFLPRRDGDLPEFYADTTLASRIFEWKPEIDPGQYTNRLELYDKYREKYYRSTCFDNSPKF